MANRSLTRHTALNVAKLVRMRRDPELAQDVADSDVIGIDGMGILWGLRLFGERRGERVAGIDLFLALLEHCATTGRRPFLLGATQEHLERAVAAAASRYPGLAFAGWRNGYFAPEDHPRVIDQIASSGADCLFVAMPTPQKERFLNAHADRLNVPFVMGVGGSVDVLAGHVSRAPRWVQTIGLEWLHRLLQEPRRMFGRYAYANTVYAAMLIRALYSRENAVRPVGEVQRDQA